MVKTYAEAGVDIDASDEATASLIAKIKGTKRKGFGEPIELVNGFAGLVKLQRDFRTPRDKALAVCTDGVGTKILLAEEMDSLHTVGIDCVAMNVNDLICVGAEPISFVDYVALNEPNNEIMGKLGEGLAEGCRQANCTLSGGETAVVPELVYGFDIAGTAVGVVSKENLIDGSKITEDDVLIGIKSSGPHSNGYTLIRKIYNGNLKYPPAVVQKIGKKLVEPTRIYVKEIMNLLNEIEVSGIAHITGGGLDNIPRMNDKFRYIIDDPLPVQAVFEWLQKTGDIETKEMYRTFNMGMGMIISMKEENVNKALEILGKDAQMIGRIENGTGVEHSAII